jgi:SAM-dependent methyltransferase
MMDRMDSATVPGPAAQRWRAELESWALPDSITSQVTESPWLLPVDVFVRRADRYLADPIGPSYARAREALVEPGTVLDVGAGAGAASLPLAAWITALVAVDPNQELLDALAARAIALNLAFATVVGRWPEAAGQVPVTDLVVCHHVGYNVTGLADFARALTDHARRRVVVELTRRHPLVPLNPLWMTFHGLVRPTGPSVDDAVAVLREAGIEPHREDWFRPPEPEHHSFDDLVDATRRRLCLPPERTAEVAAALRDRQAEENRPDLGATGDELSTLWWDA